MMEHKERIAIDLPDFPENACKQVELIEPITGEPVDIMLLRDIQNDVLKVIRDSMRMEVQNEEQAQQALSCALQARKFKATVENTRKQIVRPHIDFQKSLKTIADEIIDNFERAEECFREKVEDWMQEQSENPFTHVDAITVHDGSIRKKTHHVFTVRCEHLIPKEYLMVDEKKIKEAIAKGVTSIPGVEILSKDLYTLTVKNERK